MRSPQRLIFQRGAWVCASCRATARASFSTTALRPAKTNRRSLPETPARTRFAPSPTGYLHLGSLRTALFNYLLAKRTGGQFLLRIEDTDQKRTVPGAEQRLYDDLNWAGLHWDEGPVVGGPYGPYRQSERTSYYGTEAQNLIESGHAYRCFCTPERLDTLARHRNELGLPPIYDGKCSHVSNEESSERAEKGESHVVRLRVKEPYPMFEDIVFGRTGHNRVAQRKDGLAGQFGDPILLKSDGHPTYHLANVVDDHYMGITHVIRGTEWMSSTPMHVALYNAFKWQPPIFGHVPLLVEKSGQKLSKRNADIDISHFRDVEGIFPETLLNFAALLGWSHTQKSDVFSLKELEETFDLKLTKGNAIVAFEKLWFLQKAHAQRYATSGGPNFDAMVDQIAKAAEKTYQVEELRPVLQSRSLTEYISALVREGARTYTTANEFLENNRSLFTTSLNRPPYSPAAGTRPSTPDAKSSDPAPENPTVPLSSLHTASAALTLVPSAHWTAEAHRENISSLGGPVATTSTTDPATDKLFKKELYHYLRWALLGGAPGVGIPAALEILGREESVRRLQEARELTKDVAEVGMPKRRAGPRSNSGGIEGAERAEDPRAWMGSLAGRS